MTSASATTTPSTVATPAILATLALRLDDLHLHAQSVAGHYRPAEARVLDGHQQHQFVLPVRHALQHQHAGRLRHGLHDQHAGHHREIRKMALEKRLVVGDILDPDDAFGLHLHDAVHQQKRVAMGQNAADIVDVQNGHGSRLLSHGGRLLP